MRVLPFGMKDNFWEFDSCSPRTKIHFDRVGGDREVPHLKCWRYGILCSQNLRERAPVG